MAKVTQTSTSAAARRTAVAVVVAIALATMALLLWLLRPSPEATEAGAAPPRAVTLYPDIPRIDVHVHVAPKMAVHALDILESQHVTMALNASGGSPGGVLELSSRVTGQTDGRLRPYCSIGFHHVGRPDWEDYVEESLTRCKERGAVGLKVYKALGLGITLEDGSLLRIDDDRLDPVFEGAGDLGMPVLIHSGDPQAFFEPPTEDNERFEELQAHPSWSFHGARPDGRGQWPAWEEVFGQFERRVARHPRTTFIGAHFGNAAEDPSRVARMLDDNPRYVIETGARVPEFGRHSADEMRRFFERYQDRILFGTDFSIGPQGLVLGSSGQEPDPPERVRPFFVAHWRYFETRERELVHPTPIQGDWTVDGIGLERRQLEKLYWRNAARVFGLDLPEPGRNPAPTPSADRPPPGG